VTHRALASQHAIGWEGLFRGYVSLDWGQVYSPSDTTSPAQRHTSTVKQLSIMVRAAQDYAIFLWESRSSVRADTPVDTDAELKLVAVVRVAPLARDCALPTALVRWTGLRYASEIGIIVFWKVPRRRSDRRSRKSGKLTPAMPGNALTAICCRYSCVSTWIVQRMLGK
jgi:hypothetical protein